VLFFCKEDLQTVLIVPVFPCRDMYGEDDPSKLPERTNEATGTYAQACLTVAKELNHPVIDIWTKMQQFPDWQTSALWYGSISSDLIPKLDVWMGLITVKGCHLCYQ
jgi:hypothetical protein